MSKKSAHSALRFRREALGLSQTQLAATLGVTKSLLSLIENGKRQPTRDQITVLAKTLRVPPDLLLLDSGHLPDDIRGAFQANAAEAVAAVRQRTEAQAVTYPTAPRVLPLPMTRKAPDPATPLPERINVRKTSTSYRAHSYHTKVPPEAIQPFIRAFSRPGETIFDPFCGSGMTGVAALMEGRNALLSDLSPAAVHIARNYTTSCDPDEFAAAFAAVEREMSPTIAWLYQPVGAKEVVEYTTWSDVYRCPKCRSRIVYWDLVQAGGAIDGARLECPRCGACSRKSHLEWTGEIPVQSHTSSRAKLIDAHRPTRKELALVDDAGSAPIPYWVPTVPFGAEREMWRSAHRAIGINDVAGFFTRRNLHALAALRHAIVGASEGRVREALMFAFTAAVNRASRRYQWNAKRPTNVMTGTLYISSPEEAQAVATIVNGVLESGATWVDGDGKGKPVTSDDIVIITPYNAQVFEIQQRLPRMRVGTVDKFQGQQAAIAIYSTATSSHADVPRGMEFLYSLNRLNVATSRAKCISLMVSSPELFEAECRTARQMQLANAFCRYLELAQPLKAAGPDHRV